MSETRFESFSIVIEAPIGVVFDQWTRYAELPAILTSVESATEDGGDVEFTMNLAGRRITYRATVIERIDGERIAWRSVSGRDTGGVVRFAPQGPTRTQVTLDLRYERDGMLEIIGDELGVVTDRVRADLQRFKEYVEKRVAATPDSRGALQP